MEILSAPATEVKTIKKKKNHVVREGKKRKFSRLSMLVVKVAT